jgi:hypothetical protein
MANTHDNWRRPRGARGPRRGPASRASSPLAAHVQVAAAQPAIRPGLAVILHPERLPHVDEPRARLVIGATILAGVAFYAVAFQLLYAWSGGLHRMTPKDAAAEASRRLQRL